MSSFRLRPASARQGKFWYQLKSQKSRLGDNITDGAYDAMMNAIRRDELPSMYFMQYEIVPSLAGAGEGGCRPDEGRGEWLVRNLLLVPHFAFPPSAIIKRRPLSPTARRAGWVGCNFDLSRIPPEARIFLVRTMAPQRRSGVAPDSDLKHKEYGDRRDACPTLITPPEAVREKFKRVKPLKEIGVKERGWTLDVLNAVRRLVSEGRASRVPNISDRSGTRVTRPSDTFTTADAYAFTRELEKLHPDNRHVRDKIRQQLQVLRNAGLLLHVERGLWRLP